jgi:hypothetical protein
MDFDSACVPSVSFDIAAVVAYLTLISEYEGHS